MQRTAEGICGTGGAGFSPRCPPLPDSTQQGWFVPLRPPRGPPAARDAVPWPQPSLRSRIRPRTSPRVCGDAQRPPAEQCPRAGMGPPASPRRRDAAVDCRGFTPPKSGDIWGHPPPTGGSPVPSTGQDPAPVPAGAASHCPPRRLCSSRSPRRRAAPSHRSAARGCRRPARDPTGAGTEPGDPAGGSLVSPPDPPRTCSASRKRKEPRRRPRGTMQKVELCSSSW